MTTGFVDHPSFLAHDTGEGHFERAARLVAIHDRLEANGMFSQLDRVQSDEIDVAKLHAVHGASYVSDVKERVLGGERQLDWDTVVCEASWTAALRAAGAAVLATDKVMAGEWQNGFVAARPPGHHAEADRAMGFCLFNNVAVAAQHLRRTHGIERVAILDWDVHHGNGTQHSFERDPNVFFCSLHQFPHYPGTGSSKERGLADGEGTTLNCPMSSGADDSDYLRSFSEHVIPALEDFAPQFLLISAGFDAHERDPLSATRVTEAGYTEMTEAALDLARRVCDGRVVSLLEGGYDLDALAASVEAHLSVMLR